MEDDIEMYDMQIGFCESCGKKKPFILFRKVLLGNLSTVRNVVQQLSQKSKTIQ